MKAAFLLTALAVPAIAVASPITYNVDNVFPTFSVTGTITTDGTLGVLQTADITGYSLTLTDSFKTQTISPQQSSFAQIGGSGVTATSTGLFYNYQANESNTSYDYLFFFSSASGFTDLCYQSSGCDTFGPNANHESLFFSGLGSGGSRTETQLGNVEIAAAATTPEPGSLILLGTGTLGLIGAVRRRITR